MLPLDIQRIVFSFDDRHDQHFIQVCRSNRRQDLILLLHLKSRSWQDNDFVEQQFYRAACKGWLQTIQVLSTILQVDAMCTKNNLALCRACENGHLHVVKYLVSLLTINNLREDFIAVFTRACKSGDLNMVEFLSSQIYFVHDPRPFEEACRFGHVRVVKFLAERLAKTDMHVSAFHIACEHGNFITCKYLVSKLNIIRFDCSYTLKMVCRRGFLKIARLLCGMLDVPDLSRVLHDALCAARENSHLRIVKLIVSKLICNNIQINHKYQLICACGDGHLPTVQYFWNMLSFYDMHECYSGAIAAARYHGYVTIMQYLIQNFFVVLKNHNLMLDKN